MSNISDQDKLALSVHLEEYKALRAEIVEQIRLKASALTFGTSLLAVATAGIVSFMQHNNTHVILRYTTLGYLLAMLPIISFVFDIWMVHK
jgi:hypothetical protein